MSGRDRIRHVLRGGTADRLPRAIFGGGLWSYRQAGLRIDSLKEDPAGFGDRLADLWGGLDTDIVFLGSGLNTLPAEAIEGELAFGTGLGPPGPAAFCTSAGRSPPRSVFTRRPARTA